MYLHADICTLFFAASVFNLTQKGVNMKGEAYVHRVYAVTSQHTYTHVHSRSIYSAQKAGSEWGGGIIYITGLCSFVLLKDIDRHKLR